MTAPTFDRPVEDPRFRARRIAVARDAGRRRLHRLVALGSVTGLVLAGLGALRSPLFDVDRVVVDGAAQVAPAEVVAASGIDTGTALADLDGGAAARGVEALPWVRSATVARRWPGTVVVTVVERAPVAVVEARGGGLVLVDEDGRLLDQVRAAPAGVVRLDGVTAAGGPGGRLGDEAAEALAVAAALPEVLAPSIAAVAVDDGQVDLQLAPFGVIRLGRPVDLPAKFLAAATVLEQVDTSGFGVLDVRVPTAPALTRVPAGG